MSAAPYCRDWAYCLVVGVAVAMLMTALSMVIPSQSYHKMGGMLFGILCLGVFLYVLFTVLCLLGSKSVPMAIPMYLIAVGSASLTLTTDGVFLRRFSLGFPNGLIVSVSAFICVHLLSLVFLYIEHKMIGSQSGSGK